jgi:hypothetical protein
MREISSVYSSAEYEPKNGVLYACKFANVNYYTGDLRTELGWAIWPSCSLIVERSAGVRGAG